LIPRTLFFKIFIWFWMAAALIIGVFYLMIQISYNQSLPQRMRSSYGEAMSLYAEAAVHTYDKDGPQSFSSFVARSQRESGTLVYLFDSAGQPITNAGDDEVSALLHEILSGPAQDRYYRLASGRITWGKSITAPSGHRYIFVARLAARSVGPPFDISIPRVAVSILIAGLGCYLLALYLAAPLKKLRSTVQAFAQGNLNVRVGSSLGKRGEVQDLGRDFDHMAERISNLIASQKRLLADISHELRSPLARLSVALELARKNSAPAAAPALNRIEQESEKINGLVGQLLAITRLESGAERVPNETVILEELLHQVVDDANFEAKPLRKEVRIVQMEKCRVSGSAELLRSAIENVIRNAVRYTAERSTVEVALCWKLDTAVLTVRDYGPGVPESDLEHIFEPFYRVSEARDRASGGAGLGLSIADRTVKLHGGTISAANVEDGLVITIRLPLAPSQPSDTQDQVTFSPASLASG
jgi:signal transduction histidine kinase